MDEDLYCKVYLSSEKTKDELVSFIASVIGGNVRFCTVETRYMEVAVFCNDDFDESLTESTTDGFLYFPYYLEIEPPEENAVDSKAYKRLLNMLLNSIKKHGIKGVRLF